MKNALTLTEKETFFLKENRQDPVTGDEFFVGDEIVFCASCKSAFLQDSWEYMGSKHCGQTATLNNFPVSSKLKLSKPITYNFQKAESGNRILAYFIDNGIALIIGFFIYLLPIRFEEDIFIVFSVIAGSLYMIFRDVIGRKGSFGKRIIGLYFIDTKTKNKAAILPLFFRNLIYWFTLSLAISIIVTLELTTSANGTLAVLIGFLLTIANIVHIIAVLANQNNIFDRILKIELVEKK